MSRYPVVSVPMLLATLCAVGCNEASIPTQAPDASAAIEAIPAAGLSVDQTSGTVGSTSMGCGYQVPGILGQNFKPSWRTLGAIDIVLRVGGGFPAAGVLLTLHVDTYVTPTPGWVLVGTSSRFVPGTFTEGDTVRVRFLFLPPLQVKTNTSYRMHWTTPGDEVLTWMLGGSYPDGSAWPCGSITPSLPAYDFAFSTYRLGR